jgi:hypothetical protein
MGGWLEIYFDEGEARAPHPLLLFAIQLLKQVVVDENQIIFGDEYCHSVC